MQGTMFLPKQEGDNSPCQLRTIHANSLLQNVVAALTDASARIEEAAGNDALTDAKVTEKSGTGALKAGSVHCFMHVSGLTAERATVARPQEIADRTTDN